MQPRVVFFLNFVMQKMRALQLLEKHFDTEK